LAIGGQQVVIDFSNAFGGVPFGKAMEIISKQLGIDYSNLEADYNITLPSIAGFLKREGMILPKDFRQFWDWFVFKYSDELDEKGLFAIEQEHIYQFSKEREKELTKEKQYTIEELYRDMPEIKTYNENEDLERIKLHDARFSVYIGKDKTRLQWNLDILAVQMQKDGSPAGFARSLNEWYKLHNDKNWFIQNLCRIEGTKGNNLHIAGYQRTALNMFLNKYEELINTEPSTQPEGLPCLPEYADKLKPIFRKLKDAKLLDKTVKESDFVRAFQAGALTDWERMRWTGSNPKLSTLVYKLTGEKPIPSFVNRLFITNKYDSVSTGRTTNSAINSIFRNLPS